MQNKTPINLKPTVFIIDDDEALCEALTYLLNSINIDTETFLSGYDYLNTYDRQRQGCILSDIRMPEISGLELQKQLKAMSNMLPIIFMTGYGDVPIAVQAMREGAFDFVTKPFSNQLLLEQIQKAIQHNMNFTKMNDNGFSLKDYEHLTFREREILEKIAQGKMNKEIAFDLDITMSTVEMHRANIMKKMKSKSIAQLIKNYILVKSNFKLSLNNL